MKPKIQSRRPPEIRLCAKTKQRRKKQTRKKNTFVKKTRRKQRQRTRQQKRRQTGGKPTLFEVIENRMKRIKN